MKRSERGMHDLAEEEVIKADERNLVGDAMAEAAGGFKKADGSHVVGTNDGAGTGAHGKEPLCSGPSSGKPVVSFKDPLILEGEST